jgi:hypothetical protein
MFNKWVAINNDVRSPLRLHVATLGTMYIHSTAQPPRTTYYPMNILYII